MTQLTARILSVVLLSAVAVPCGAGGWKCFDGSVCRYTPTKGFECHSLLPASETGCCPHENRRPCQHGFLPLAVEGQSHGQSNEVGLRNTCCCRFVTAVGNRVVAIQRGISQPIPVSVTNVTFADGLGLAPESTVLHHEDSLPHAREGPTPHAGRAPPLS